MPNREVSEADKMYAFISPKLGKSSNSQNVHSQSPGSSVVSKLKILSNNDAQIQETEKIALKIERKKLFMQGGIQC